jgi:hypothetical protein
MHAYVFGRHEGEPPTHLVGQTFGGVTVQSMTALDGPEHTLFTKLHAADGATFSQPMSLVEPLGTLVKDGEVTVHCDSPDCAKLVGDIVSRISFIGREDDYYASSRAASTPRSTI